MAFIVEDFVKETTSTTGTGDITLAGTGGRGAAIPFATVCSNGDTFPYAISHTSANEWEVGIGTFHSPGSTFTRTTVQRSSNANAAVSFSAGTKNVDLTLTSTHIKQLANIAGLTGVLRSDSGVASVDSDVTDIVTAATTSAAGKVELADNAEQLTGTDATRAATPDSVAALWEKGTDNTGAGTITLGDGYQFDLITSTTTITAFAFTTDKAGRTALLRFATTRSITHNATSLISLTGQSLTVRPGDFIIIESLGSGNFRIVNIIRGGVPLGVLQVLSATVTATNATTNLSCAGSFTIPAGSAIANLTTYSGRVRGSFVHTAAGTPTITCEIVINGTALTNGSFVFTPIATAATYDFELFWVLRCVTTGGSGTWVGTVIMLMGAASSATTEIDGNNSAGATDVIDSTVDRTLEFRVRMTTAVASNTLTVIQAHLAKDA